MRLAFNSSCASANANGPVECHIHERSYDALSESNANFYAYLTLNATLMLHGKRWTDRMDSLQGASCSNIIKANTSPRDIIQAVSVVRMLLGLHASHRCTHPLDIYPDQSIVLRTVRDANFPVICIDLEDFFASRTQMWFSQVGVTPPGNLQSERLCDIDESKMTLGHWAQIERLLPNACRHNSSW